MSQIKDNFKHHLEIENNNRIIFSAPFGIGKTYFLKEFFDKDNLDEYEAFHLFPINYHIASNEDVVDFLKYDILKMLVEKQILDFSELEAKKFLTSMVKLGLRESLNIFIEILLNISESLLEAKGIKIDKMIKVVQNAITKVDDNYKLEKKDIVQIRDFMDSTNKNKLNINGTDIISGFIKNILAGVPTTQENKAQDQTPKKQNILIIDDLDRLDAEHIFRILNVFSAFNDFENGENKFGFDKIILVFDVNNLRSIYKHRYGEEADFNGYLDKFYSLEIFDFSNEMIGEVWDKIYKKMWPNLWETHIQFNHDVQNSVNFIVQKLIIYNLLNYRILQDFEAKTAKPDFINKLSNIAYRKPKLEQITMVLSLILGVEPKYVLKKLKNKEIGKTHKDDVYKHSTISHIEEYLCLELYPRSNRIGKKLKSYHYKSITRDDVTPDLKFEDENKIIEDWDNSTMSDKMIKIDDMSDIWSLYLESLTRENS